jgi:hypothetical protein
MSSIRDGYFKIPTNELIEEIASDINIDNGYSINFFGYKIPITNGNYHIDFIKEQMNIYRKITMFYKDKFPEEFPPKNNTTKRNHRPEIPNLNVDLKENNGNIIIVLNAGNFKDIDGDSHKYTWWGIREKDTKKYIFDSPFFENQNKYSIYIKSDSQYFKSKLKPNKEYEAVVAFSDDKGLFSKGKFVLFRTPQTKVPVINKFKIQEIFDDKVRFALNYDLKSVSNADFKIYINSDILTFKLNKDGYYSDYINNLQCGETYSYYISIKNEYGSNKSETRSFTTLPCSPKISVNAIDEQKFYLNFNHKQIGNCYTKKIIITKENDSGTATGELELKENTDNVFKIKNSNYFNLTTKGASKTFEIEFCPSKTKAYDALIQVKGSNLSFESNRKGVVLFGIGDNNSNNNTDDLYFEKVTVNDKATDITVKSGENISLYAKEKYKGSKTGEVVNYIGYYLSKDNILDKNSDTKIGSDKAFPDSKFGHGKRETYKIPSNLSGKYYIFFVADDTALVDEGENENNNVRYIKITIKTNDTDGDGYTDNEDVFPNNPNEWADNDSDGIGDNADTDDDNDGISDKDEVKYGLDPKDSSDANKDNDGDGVSNIDEIKAGTNPNDKTQNVLDINLSKNDIVIHHNRTDYVSFQLSSYYDDKVTLDINSKNDFLDIQKDWSNPIEVDKYKDKNLTVGLKVKDDVSLSNDVLLFSLEDEHNHKITKELNVTILEKYELYISKGWSLKSLPTNQTVDAYSFRNSTILWKWDKSEKNWLAWSPDSDIRQKIIDNSIELFYTIKPSEGFWIKSEKDYTKNFEGDIYGFEKINLTQGWNLVGVGKDITVDEINDVAIKYIWLFRDGKWMLWGKSLAQDNYKKFEKIKTIKAGEGFWILSNKP